MMSGLDRSQIIDPAILAFDGKDGLDTTSLPRPLDMDDEVYGLGDRAPWHDG